MKDVNNLNVSFKTPVITLAIICLIIVSIYHFYIQLISKQFEIYLNIFSVLIITFSIWIYFNYIDQIIYEEEKISLKKKFKYLELNDVDSIRFIYLPLTSIILVSFNFQGKRTKIGLYAYFKKEHDKLIDFLHRKGIRTEFQTIFKS